MNEATHCIEQGRAALAAGRIAEAGEWFGRAAALEPANTEAQLQHALCALMTGDRSTFAGVYAAFRERMESETSPRLVRLWTLVQRFSGTAAAVAATVALSGAALSTAACSNGKQEGTTAARPDEPVPTNPTTTEPTNPTTTEPATKDSTPTTDVAPMDDEVYSKHRYSAGVRPPAPAPEPEEEEDEEMKVEMKPTPMRPPATKYAARPRYGGGLRGADF